MSLHQNVFGNVSAIPYCVSRFYYGVFGLPENLRFGTVRQDMDGTDSRIRNSSAKNSKAPTLELVS